MKILKILNYLIQNSWKKYLKLFRERKRSILVRKMREMLALGRQDICITVILLFSLIIFYFV
jgi:hypothetical protein